MELLAFQTVSPGFWEGVIASLTFGLVGIVLLIVGFFLFEIVTPKLKVMEELNKGNMAVGVVVAALLIGIAYIAAHVVH